MKQFHLFPRKRGHTNSYDKNIEGRNTNEFAAAAFRFGHGTIPKEVNDGEKMRLLRKMFRSPSDEIDENGGKNYVNVKLLIC